jgi:hypothetical protein
VLVPAVISFLLFRFFIEGRLSRRRLKLLEKKSAGSGSRRLFHILRDLEKQFDDVVEDIVTPPDASSYNSSSNASSDSESEISLASTCAPQRTRKFFKHARHKSVSAKEQHDFLTASQLKQISQLNTLPNLKKERAFIHPINNSHAAIVCRNGLNVKGNEMGVEVVRHWADNFII